MGATASFDYQVFKLRYPEFNAVPEALVAQYFIEATLFHANNGSGPVCDAPTQLLLLNMVTAHIAQLNAPAAVPPQPGSPQMVGAISSASEGSVSVSATNNYPPGSAQWWQQTKYGSSYWTATAAYRTMHYIPNPGRNMNPFYPIGARFPR